MTYGSNNLRFCESPLDDDGVHGQRGTFPETPVESPPGLLPGYPVVIPPSPPRLPPGLPRLLSPLPRSGDPIELPPVGILELGPLPI